MHSLKYIGDMTIVGCSVPLTKLFPYLSFDFLHYICKERKFLIIWNI